MATTTINTTGAEDTRIVVAFGHILGLGRNATQAEVTAAMRAWLRDSVRADEAFQQQAALVPPTPINPT